MRIQKFPMNSGHGLDSPFQLDPVALLLHTFTISSPHGSE